MTAPEIVAHTELHPLPDGELRLLGAVRQVTGAMTRVDAGGRRLLVDCGLAVGRESARLPEAASESDALILTHGHLDHIGHVPQLLDGGYDRPIYATPATLAIARVSIEDSLGMQRVSDEEARRLLARFDRLSQPIKYERPTDIRGARLTFHEAGHILGSASVEIETERSRVLLSGDLGRPDSPILRDPNTQYAPGKAFDVVVMESTYGSRDHGHTHGDIERDLEAIVTEALQRGGKILIPSFAIGRTQTLLYYLNTLVEARRVPEVPVMIDTPMGYAITRTYNSFQRLFDKESLDKLAKGDDPLDFENLFRVERGRDSARLHEVDGPMIIIAGSGMCTGGRIVHHLREGLDDERTTVIFVGYQAAGTPGRRIQEAARSGGKVRMNGQEMPVRAHITTLSGLSAHADRGELLAWLKAIPSARRVALHHGEVEAQEAFAEWAGRA